MENMPIISVIVPVHNCASYLDKCMTSLLNQTMTQIEIITVNNGSTDESESILRKYAQMDSRVTVISQENKGVQGARNTGLRNVRGEYVAFVDADDYVELTFCELLYTAISKNNSDIAICDYFMKYASKETNSTLGLDSATASTSDLEQHILYLRYFAKNPVVWNKLYRRKIIENSHLEFEVQHGEDLLFNLRLLPLIQKISTIRDSLYHYVQRKSSLAHSLDEVNKDSIQILECYLQKPVSFDNSLLTNCAFASVFTGFAFSSHCIGKSIKYFYQQLQILEASSFFHSFCVAIVKTDKLTVLYEECAISRRFYRIIRAFCFLYLGRHYLSAALFWWGCEQLIILKKRRFLFDQVH